MGAGRADHRLYWIILHSAFWAFCAYLKLPFSYFDNSLIVGPAIGIVDGHGLQNIYISKEFYPEQTYLFYPPTFFWVLAGWIAAFGRSVASLSLFWAACGLGISLSAGALLSRLARTQVGYLVAPVLVFGLIAYTGYRYEILAFATLLSGIVLCVGGRRLAGYLLLCLTPTIAPTMIGYTIVAIAALILHRRGDAMRRDVARLAIAFVIALLWLTISVEGHLIDLIDTMYRYRTVRIGIGGRAVRGDLPTLILEVNLLAVLIARYAARRPWNDRFVIFPLLLTATWQLTLLTHARPAVLVSLNIMSLTLFALIVAQAVVERLPGHLAFVSRHMSGIALGAVALLLLWLNVGYATTMPLRPLTPAMAEKARAMAAAAGPDQTLIVDARVMRDALHYPSGRRIEDSMVRHAWPNISQDYHKIADKQLWIVGVSTINGGLGAPLARHWLDGLFIAPGVGGVQEDGICRLDAATSRQWRSDDPADLIKLACR